MEAEDSRFPRARSKQDEIGRRIGADGMRLLQVVTASDAPGLLRSLPQVEILRQIWIVADSEFGDCAVVGVSFGDRSGGRLADCAVEGTRGDGVRHNGLVELVSLRTSRPVVEQSTELVVPAQTIVNNFNAPVFNAEVHGVQLAWNNTEAVQQQTGEGETPT